jgi:hypothetical protein
MVNPQPFSPSAMKSLLFVLVVVIGAAILIALGLLVTRG